MDRQAFIKSIVEETLPNDEALIDLFARKNQHAASDPEEPLFEAIQQIFEDATLAATQAVAAHQPIVKVLSEVLQAIGRLKVQAGKSDKEHNKAAAQAEQEQVQKQEKLPSGAVLGDNTFTKSKSGNNKADTEKTSPEAAENPAEKPAGQAESKSAPPEGRRKLHPYPPTRLLRSQSRSVSPSGGFGSLSAAPTSPKPVARLLAPPSSTALKAASTGLSARPKQPANTPSPTTKPTTRRKAETQPEDPPPFEPIRKRRRRAPKTPLSKEIISDSDASDTSDNSDLQFTMRTKIQKSAVSKNNARDSEGSKSQTPEVPAYVDIFAGLSGFEYFDENGAPAKRPHGRLALINGEIEDALTVRLKLDPKKLQDKLQELESSKRKASSQLEPKAKRPSTGKYPQTSAPTPLTKRCRPSPPTHSVPPSTTNPIPTMSPTSTTTTRSRSRKTLITPSPLSTNSPTKSPTPFPPFPPLTPTHLPPFTKGLTIAISNILSDHAASPSLSILSVIAELEEDAPTLPTDDYRRVVMGGSEYVYGAVRAVFEGTAGGEGSEGKGLVKDGIRGGAGDGKEEKVCYKGLGRGWKKTGEDADLDCVTEEEKGGRKKSMRGRDTWAGTEKMFREFCAHVRREYEAKVELLGVEVDEELPRWLVE